MKLTPLRVTLFAMLLVVAWQAFVVTGWGGNWTMLFYAGERYPPPPYLAERMYQFPDSNGFDGQFYLYIAHDPADTMGTSRYVDNPAVRWRRILVPGLAWLLSFGQLAWVPWAYILVVWAFTAAGIYLLSILARQLAHPALTGILFLAVPAVLISLDRMMTDVALLALMLALVWAIRAERPGLAYAFLILLPLARETGLAFTAA